MLFVNPKFKSWSDLSSLAQNTNVDLKQKLFKHTDSYLNLTYGEINKKYGRWPRLFIYSNIVSEVSLAYEYSGELKYLDFINDLLEQVSKDDSASRNMFDKYQPHGPGIFLCSLAKLYFTSERLKSNKKFKFLLKKVSFNLGSFIFSHKNTSAWGDDKKARFMWNHSVCGFAGLYMGAQILKDLDLSETCANEWLEYAEPRVLAFCENGLTECGVNREGLSYAGMTFKAVAPCLWDIKFRRGGLPVELYSRLKNYVTYVAYEVVPSGGRVWNYNDSYMNPLLGLNGYLSIATLVDETRLGAAVWNELLGEKGNASMGIDEKLWRSSFDDTCLFGVCSRTLNLADLGLPLSHCFKEKGYFVSRSSWHQNAHAFTFTSGKGYDRIHQQSDHNSFTFAVDGKPIIIDSGPSNEKYLESASQSYGHQSIQINGKGMFLCGGKDSSSGQLEAEYQGENFCYVCGDARLAYNRENYNKMRKARRHVWVIWKPHPMLIVYDDYISASKGEKSISWLMHLAAGIDLVDVNDNSIKLSDKSDQYYRLQLFGRGEKQSVELVPFNNPKSYDDELLLKHGLLKINDINESVNYVSVFTVDSDASLKNIKINRSTSSVEATLCIAETEQKIRLATDFSSNKKLDQQLKRLSNVG